MSFGRRLYQIWHQIFGAKPELSVRCLTNETEDLMFVPFLDYDRVYYRVVLRDLQRIHKLFGLCTFVVTSSDEFATACDEPDLSFVGNFNVFGLDKMEFREHIQMLRCTRSDAHFWKNPIRYPQRSWSLRISSRLDRSGRIERDAPHHFALVHFKDPCKREHSLAHWEFYRKVWDLPNLNPKPKFDNFENLIFVDILAHRKSLNRWKL